MSELKTSEVLDLAADKIEEHGWVQGTEGWDKGCGAGLCLEGGIAAAMGITFLGGPNYMGLDEFQEGCPAYRAVKDYLGYDRDLWRWNDATGRTAEEVIEVLRAAAAVERAKEESLEHSAVTA